MTGFQGKILRKRLIFYKIMFLISLIIKTICYKIKTKHALEKNGSILNRSIKPFHIDSNNNNFNENVII